VSGHPEIRAVATRFGLDLNMSEASAEGIMGDWHEVTCGSDLHDEIERAMDEAGIDHDWERIGERGYWIVRAAPQVSVK
jgi:hypothetical protein